MRATSNVLLTLLLCLAITNCSHFSKDAEDAKEEEVPKYENYNTSGVYDDIPGEPDSSAEESPTESYADDNYGTVDEAITEEEAENSVDQPYLAGADDSPEEPVVEEPAMQRESEPLPIDALQATKPTRNASSKSFKNGFYQMKRKCNMRENPSSKSAKLGKVKKGQKLWVEGHNSKWAKVYKKSGPVYISRICF